MRTKFERYTNAAPLNKWHLVNSIDGVQQENLYVRFVFCWDLEGNKLYEVPVSTEVSIELEYKKVENKRWHYY